ncbi:MAG: NUDIX domain-containing protein, partial [Anaerolineaceae bacterium]|nr:NUDIX domain-containing protein [Anaerolineaceae bacterium]
MDHLNQNSCFTIAAFAVIFDELDRVLLCHRRDMDKWNLPGGGVERGEIPTEAVIREVREETGLEVVVEKLTGIYGKQYKDELVFTFICRIIGGELTTTSECSENQYFALDDLPQNTIQKH